MFEGFFILTTIFCAYVVYTVIGEKKASAKFKPETTKTETPSIMEQKISEVAVAKEEPVKVKTVTTKTVKPKPKDPVSEPDEPKVAATKTTKAKPAPAKKAVTVPAVKRSGLKDPISGDIATAYNNYRFTKRWIKDALVAEGLLEKVYGTNELNPEINAKIKEAITRLEGIDKYKA